MELVNAPVPVPFVVLVLNEVVGSADVLQQTPRAVTDAPPSLVIFPPLVAVFCVINDAAVVIRTGITGAGAIVVNVVALLYEVPTELIA
jgi:hypothetical protein